MVITWPDGSLEGATNFAKISQSLGCSKSIDHAKTFEALI
jgi:hypothetical protein